MVFNLSRNGASICMNNIAMQPVVESIRVIQQSLERGETIYGRRYRISQRVKRIWFDPSKLRLPGVNTGFGGSANTRTKAIEELQRLLLRGLHYGMLAQPADRNALKRERKPKDLIFLLFFTNRFTSAWQSRSCYPYAGVLGSSFDAGPAKLPR